MPVISTDIVSTYRAVLISQMEAARQRVDDDTLPENMRGYYAGYADAIEAVIEQLQAMVVEGDGTS